MSLPHVHKKGDQSAFLGRSAETLMKETNWKLTIVLKKKLFPFTSSWPFVAGLAFSGAIFFKIATSVTGEW